jgi:hypothetical protein
MTSIHSNEWQSAYSVDFTALASQNLRTGGNGSKTIDGRVWTWANDTNAATADVTNGSGIVLVANANSSDYNGATRTAPILTIPLSSLFSNYSVENHIVRVRARLIVTNATANFEGGALYIEDSVSPTQQNISIWSVVNASKELRIFETANGTSVNEVQNIARGAEDAFTLILEAPDKYEAWSGTYSGGFPANPGFGYSAKMITAATPLWSVQSSPRIGLLVATANTSNHGTTSTITHLMVDYFSKHPAP